MSFHTLPLCFKHKVLQDHLYVSCLVLGSVIFQQVLVASVGGWCGNHAGSQVCTLLLGCACSGPSQRAQQGEVCVTNPCA